jgi:hypothetical protein
MASLVWGLVMRQGTLLVEPSQLLATHWSATVWGFPVLLNSLTACAQKNRDLCTGADGSLWCMWLVHA